MALPPGPRDRRMDGRTIVSCEARGSDPEAVERRSPKAARTGRATDAGLRPQGP
ncbi:hypothetical protein RC1_1610 [Rhodospirillum centenum SW]|uniref:Uncharacterized protein n=1 Tax=Rhodospirillum centenum (strain ATCC 51521 / SW) TaxID=414684 RepID=B6INB5_RHOCS|nr:hypothetical protein RC1_1610 [Rhodospirillum centenum SW]